MPVSTDDHNALQLHTKHSKYKYQMFSALKYSYLLIIKKKHNICINLLIWKAMSLVTQEYRKLYNSSNYWKHIYVMCIKF